MKENETQMTPQNHKFNDFRGEIEAILQEVEKLPNNEKLEIYKSLADTVYGGSSYLETAKNLPPHLKAYYHALIHLNKAQRR